MYYQTNLATSDNQDAATLTLSQILLAIQALSPSESQEAALLTSILQAFAPQSTAALQASGNTSLASILALLAAQATAAKQDIGNASLASIDAKIGSSSSSLTSVAQSPTSGILLPANPNRKGFSLYNDSTVKCFVAMAGTASDTSFSVLISPNSGYEPIQTAVYKGVISAKWNSGTSGFMRITEFT